MLRSCILIIILCVTSPVFAATIRGNIKDAKDSSAASDVTVVLSALNRSTTTDIAGHYELINIPDGTYEIEFSFTAYKPEKRTVTVTGGADVTLDLMMASKNSQLKGARVRAQRVTKTESAVVLEIKKSSVAVSGISAAQISKTQDRNAADVVKRIPGVTIQDDRFIVVRGLAERYNTVWLNDAGAPSSEIDKKAFSFDLIPSGLIDRILIFKTPAADLPGDFAGGMAKIYTSSMPAKTEYNFAIQGSYRSGSTGTDFNYEPRHFGDAFGYDNGSRNIPAAVPTEMFNKNDPNIKVITQSFANDWIINTQKQNPDLRLSASAANLLKLGTIKLGNTFGVSYANTRTNYNVQNYDWDSTSENIHYNDKTSDNKVNLALVDNIAAVIGNSKIELRTLYNQIGRSNIISRTSVQDSAITSFTNNRGYQLYYENRKTLASQLSGSHHNESETRKYNWTLGYSSLIRNQPDIRRLNYYENQQNPGQFIAQVSFNPDPNYGGGRLYGNLDEYIYSFSHQFTQKVNVTKNFSFDLNLGNYIEYKKRSYNLRELGYTIMKGPNSSALLSLPIDQIFETPNVGDGTNFRMEDATHDYNHYKATNTLIASFASLNIPIGNRVKALIGMRYESNQQNFEAVSNLDTIKPVLKTDYKLPSFNLTYNFTAKMLLRLAYGKTLNRPEFREQAPTYYYDFSQRSGTYGTLYRGYALDVAEVQNFDARWEYYPSAGELIHVGVFYKSFKNPIQQMVLGGLSEGFSFVNGTKAQVAGLEVDVRKNLMFLDDKLGTRFLQNFVVVGNLSLAKSELTIDSLYADKHQADIVLKGPLQGQSNYVVNAGLFYQNDSLGFQGSVLYNSYSPRLYAIGRRLEGSIGELAFHSLDVTLSKVFAKHYTLTFGVQNLLDESVRFVNDTNEDNKFDAKSDMPYQTYKPGRYFTVGLKVKF